MVTKQYNNALSLLSFFIVIHNYKNSITALFVM